MYLVQKVYYALMAIYMLTIGKWTHPEAHQRYYIAKYMVERHPEFVNNNLLKEKCN